MKSLKKVFSLLVAIVMMVGLSVSAFAAEPYQITINDAVKGQTYKAYKIFDATYVNDANGVPTSVSYTISTGSDWYSVIGSYTQTETTEGVEQTYKAFVLTPSAGDATTMVVTVQSGKEINPITLAKYLNDHKSGKTAAATETAAGNSVTLDVNTSGAGYYFVDTSLGALCSLDTVTGTNTAIEEKNAEPSLTKSVQEDSTGNFGHIATADMNQEVTFKLEVGTGNDSRELEKDFVITDTLPAGMTYKAGSLTISGWTLNTDYTVSSAGNVLTITLKETKLEGLGASETFDITYVATVNQDAVVLGAGNTNTATLAYNGYNTTEVDATVFTYRIGKNIDGEPTFTKVDGANTDKKLAGVTFILSKTETEPEQVGDEEVNTEYFAVLDEVTETTGEGENAVTTVVGYKLNHWTTTEANATPIVTGEDGSFRVDGLDAHTYILTETGTLPGYNLLTDTITAVIAEDGTVTYKMTSATGDGTATITVENNTGTELPTTGGIGTTIFYLVGSVMVVGAAVLLVVKKRAANAE